jgi:hypothetical protein
MMVMHNTTTNESTNASRYPHFVSNGEGGYINPFSRGTKVSE